MIKFFLCIWYWWWVVFYELLECWCSCGRNWAHDKRFKVNRKLGDFEPQQTSTRSQAKRQQQEIKLGKKYQALVEDIKRRQLR